MDQYYIPAAQFSLKSKVSNSRFIATIAPAFTVDSAKQFISTIKEKYADATHNVPVYIIGHGSSMISHASDDGEPSGTAGRPALSVLTGSGLGDAALVITRYFGGTKLGTGGLVKAYSEAARAVINAVPKATRILVHQLSIGCPYNLYEIIVRIINQHQGQIKEEQFAEKVNLIFDIPVSSFEMFMNAISEASNGQIQPEVINQDQIAILNVSPKDASNPSP